MPTLLAMIGVKVMQSTTRLLPRTMFYCTSLRTQRSKVEAGKPVVGGSQAGLLASLLNYVTSKQSQLLSQVCSCAVDFMCWQLMYMHILHDVHTAWRT